MSATDAPMLMEYVPGTTVQELVATSHTLKSESSSVNESVCVATQTFWKRRRTLTGTVGSVAAEGAPRYSCGVSHPEAVPVVRRTEKDTTRPVTVRALYLKTPYESPWPNGNAGATLALSYQLNGGGRGGVEPSTYEARAHHMSWHSL